MSNDNRFEVVYQQKTMQEGIRILRDRVTGVCYLSVNQFNMSGGGLTVLLDRDGKPVVMDEPSQG